MSRISRYNPYSSIYGKAFLTIVIVVCVGLGVWLVIAGKYKNAHRGMAALRMAYAKQRLSEARISGLDYAPLFVSRGPEKPAIDYLSRDRAEGLLLDAVTEQPNAESQHALGRFYLAGGKPEKAIDLFEKALARKSNDSLIHSDLGAAFIEVGREAKRDGDASKALTAFVRSLEQLHQALQITPALPDALYNKATCFEYMMLPEQAKEAWHAYLAGDSHSKWAEEATRRLEFVSFQRAPALTAPELLEGFLAAFHSGDEERAWRLMSQNREIITGKMIQAQLQKQFLSATPKGSTEAGKEALLALLFAGKLDLQRGGDPYTTELANYYAAATARQHLLLGKASDEIYKGYGLCLDTKYDSAIASFESARSLFEAAGDVWEARLADYWIGYCLTQAEQIEPSMARLKVVKDFCDGRDYKWLLAQACGWLAINYAVSSQHSNAIKYYQQSLSLAEAISDTYQSQKMLTELGVEYAELRQPQASLGYFYRALSSAAATNTGSRQSWRNFSYATSALFAFKYYEAAAAFANETLSMEMREVNDPSLTYHLHLNLAQIYSRLARFADAMSQAGRGLEIAQTIQDNLASQKFTANAFLQLAHIQREAGNFAEAIGNFNRAIELYEHLKFDLHLYSAYKGRLLCALALRDDAKIEKDLSFILQLFEQYRDQIREERNRDSFFDTEQGIYDIAVEYEYGKHNYLKALDYAETARARSLADALQSKSVVERTAFGPELVYSVSHPPDLDSIRKHIPPQTQVISFTVLPDRLLVWNISRELVDIKEEKITAVDLEAKVKKYLDSIYQSRTGANQSAEVLGKELYQILLGPLESGWAPGQKICVIPDKFLHRLPFAALISPNSGRYVIEDHTLSYTPGLNVFRLCSEIAQRKSRAIDESVLSIGDPAFDRREYPDIPRLESAGREASEVSGLFGKSTCLLGAEANKQTVLRAMNSAEIVHFAGHYVIDDSSPMLSRMLLASGGAENAGRHSSDLSAFEILEHHFERTKLIVLSACQTEFDTYYGGEGAVGLSRTFIAAGIPLIVASQWAVDSDGTASLMVRFYQHRRSGLATTEALQRAQLELIRGTDQTYRAPYYWAAFLCVGGAAEY